MGNMNDWSWKDRDGTERYRNKAKKLLKKKYRVFNKKTKRKLSK